MWKFLRGLAAAVVVAVFVAGMAPTPAVAQSAPSYRITIHNHSNATIMYVYYRFEGDPNWGPDRLGSSVISPGDLSWYFDVQTSNCSRVEFFARRNDGRDVAMTLNPCVPGVEEIDIYDTYYNINQR